jgi:hypothetical protein
VGRHELVIAKWGGCPVTPSAWTNLGHALPGSAGPPLLAGTGTLAFGDPGTLTLSHAAPSAPTHLFLSLSNAPHAFKGGTLLTVPVLQTLPLVTSPAGEVSLPFAAWPAGLSGQQLLFQAAIQDASAVQGVALSNALSADIP